MVYGYVNNTTKFFDYLERDDGATYYDEPRWTRVDQLRMGDILINSLGNYYVVACVKPFYKSKLDEYAWLQRGQIMGGWQGSLDFFPNPDFYGFLKTSTPILIRVYF